jgi:hypothetical protein
MAKEDLLSKQINQLGYFLRRIFEKITKRDAGEDVVSEINTELKETLGFDLERIEAIPNEEIVSFLLQNEYFTPENIEIFADILIKSGRADFQKKALWIYEYIDIITATFSMERNLKIQNLKKNLL